MAVVETVEFIDPETGEILPPEEPEGEEIVPVDVSDTFTELWDKYHYFVLASIVGGLAGRFTGRDIAKFENTFICGLYNGFSALRDPRDALWKQLSWAVISGASWGLSDVYVPKVLDYFSGRKVE